MIQAFLIALYTLVIGTVAIVFLRAFGPLGEGWDDVLGFLPFLAGGVALALLLNVGYGEFARARRRRLTHDHGDAAVFTAEMTPALKKYLQFDWSRDTSAQRVGQTPHFFTTVASPDGTSLWNGRHLDRSSSGRSTGRPSWTFGPRWYGCRSRPFIASSCMAVRPTVPCRSRRFRTEDSLCRGIEPVSSNSQTPSTS